MKKWMFLIASVSAVYFACSGLDKTPMSFAPQPAGKVQTGDEGCHVIVWPCETTLWEDPADSLLKGDAV